MTHAAGSRRRPERNRLVAIVDDDALVRSSMASLIRSFGFDTAMFDSAERLLASAPELFDCIVSDVQMGGMTGLELHRELKRRGVGAALILVTAYPNRRIRERALEEGARYLLEKPWSADDMAHCLEDILGRLA
ncbi:response regulator transcription factor [Sphingobium sp. EM0848]|uniref:response regulator transcription factor n=1 Tax=Sphingobium sp. EM0848 TaxID=2743473 RepID=UPI00159CA00F|nr:response regulator [Sphingobium sp. EM0848]